MAYSYCTCVLHLRRHSPTTPHRSSTCDSIPTFNTRLTAASSTTNWEISKTATPHLSRIFKMRLQLLTLLATLAPSVLAIPQIVSPAAGAAVAAGSLVVKWSDDSTSPSLSQFSTYTLTLFVGGNEPDAGVATTVR